MAAAKEGEQHSALPYILVWVALVVLTATTYVTGHKMHLGTWALPLALAIAVTKSLLVILFFMHLWEQKGVNRIVIATSFVFVALIISLTVADVATRFPLATPAGAPFGTDVPAQLEEPAPEIQPPTGPIGQPPPGTPEPK
ncbi:MAG TPA: cytochrome C oxidase subunit IV family protein [Myxococcales bacterium]|nr:cytochrome C oxidase subunit IV family protein [Myxococcales bacterium]